MNYSQITELIADIDWQKVLNTLESLAVIVASIFAIVGIYKWRKENIWKRKYELAEEVMVAAYQTRDDLNFIRNPHGFASEGKDREAPPNETDEERIARDKYYFAFRRFQQAEGFNKLQSLRWRFTLLFGDQYMEMFNEAIQLVRKVVNAANLLAFIEEKKQVGTMGEQYNAQTNILFYQGEKNDIIVPNMDAIIERFEKVCKPMISKGKQ